MDEKKLSSETSSMDENQHNASTEVAQIKQINVHKMPDVESQRPSIYKCQYPGLDNVVFVRGSGPHKFHYGDQPGQPMKEVIVSRKCAEAVLRGAQVHKHDS